MTGPMPESGDLWSHKPWWCQPWSILLTGVVLVGGSDRGFLDFVDDWLARQESRGRLEKLFRYWVLVSGPLSAQPVGGTPLSAKSP